MFIQSRDFLKFLVFSILTCGIYALVFWFRLVPDVNRACAGDNEETPGYGRYIIFTILTCGIYGFFWYYKLGERLWKNAPRYGLNFNETGTTILLWMVLGSFLFTPLVYFADYLIIKNCNAIFEKYNSYISGANTTVNEPETTEE